jgi:hypothetical protein
VPPVLALIGRAGQYGPDAFPSFGQQKPIGESGWHCVPLTTSANAGVVRLALQTKRARAKAFMGCSF